MNNYQGKQTSTLKYNLTVKGLVIVGLIAFSFSSCSLRTDVSLSYTDGGDINFGNSVIRLTFDSNMHGTVTDIQSGVSLTVSDQSSLARPTHFIVVEGQEVADFTIDYGNLELEPINNNFGRGKRLVLTGNAGGYPNRRIAAEFVIELYDNYPSAAITYATYKNVGEHDLLLDEVYSNYYRLDASRDGSSSKSWGFWSFQGSALGWGRDYIFPLSENFHQENWMGVQPETKTGGGVPVIDLWTSKAGLGIAHLEPVPKLVHIPVEVEDDGRVRIAIKREVGTTLKPGDSYQTLKTAVIIHQLDYYDCINTYAGLMAAQGVKMKKSSDAAYEPIWCSWGYRSDFTAEEVLQTLPKLEAMGLNWVVIDDRWFDRYGDWNLRTDIWDVGGTNHMKVLVDTLHALGYKVKIWWDPPTAQPEHVFGEFPDVEQGASNLVQNHPEWLIMDADGTYPIDERGMNMPCPSVPEVIDYFRDLTVRFIRDWDFDGHKLDAYWTVPPCYNPAHNHQRPEESHEDLPILLQAIYETTKSIKPNSVIEICNCGTVQDFWQAAWIDQPVSSDPVNAFQVRKRIKVFKALMGPDVAAYADHVELTAVDTADDWKEIGRDFATAVGTGAVVGTKFTWPTTWEGLDVLLTAEEEAHWTKWINLYREKMLSKGQYLNLYDITHDKPEAHVISKGDTLYYAFYAERWTGEIRLRGLDNTEYQVYDYVNNVDLGRVQGPVAMLSPSFTDNLLIECIPVN